MKKVICNVYRGVWNKCSLVAPANGAQYDQTIRKNVGEDSVHGLSETAAHEVLRDARGVLARSHRQRHQGH